MRKLAEWKDVKEGQRLLIARNSGPPWYAVSGKPYSVTVCEVAKTAVQLMNDSNGRIWWLLFGRPSDTFYILEEGMTTERIEAIAKAEKERIAAEHDALMRKIRALKGWKKWLFILAFGNYPWIEEEE